MRIRAPGRDFHGGAARVEAGAGARTVGGASYASSGAPEGAAANGAEVIGGLQRKEFPAERVQALMTLHQEFADCLVGAHGVQPLFLDVDNVCSESALPRYQGIDRRLIPFLEPPGAMSRARATSGPITCKPVRYT